MSVIQRICVFILKQNKEPVIDSCELLSEHGYWPDFVGSAILVKNDTSAIK